MQNKRRHKRYRLDSMEINGKMNMVNRVEIIDISLSGASLKVDKKLDLGKEYQIRLGDRDKKFDVKGLIVRSEVYGIEEKASGSKADVYAAGMMFNGGQMDKLALFLYAIDQKKKMNAVAAERRLKVRFQITTPGENVLSYPAQFKVRTISLSGMLVQTDIPLEIESRLHMGLSLRDDENQVNLIGRVVTCQIKEKGGRTYYEIGAEFMDVTEKDKVVLKAFTDNLAAMEAGVEGGT
jgi:PilZ domain